MRLRKGKPKTILEGAIDSALLAVEVYNKPRATFRTQAFISLMIVAWTRLLHAHFQRTIGSVYYEKQSNGRFKIVNGEKWAWDLMTSVGEFNKREKEPIPKSVKKNIQFFIKLRNKIEHKHLTKSDLDRLVFGECQALLYNFESLLVRLFGEEFALHENLVFSLQFSRMRTSGQAGANKMALSKDLRNVTDFVMKFRNNLDQPIFQSQEYSIKLLQIPRISNTNKRDTAIEFVRWDELSEEDRQSYDEVVALIKDKRIEVEAVNVDRLKAGQVCAKVEERTGLKLSPSYHHVVLARVFNVRPPKNGDDPFDTNTDYCHYDDAHKDYVYQAAWVDFIVNLIEHHNWTIEKIREAKRNDTRIDPATILR